jgi:hypothetical protein
MNLFDAITEVRRRMGIIFMTKGDIEWIAKKFINENREVFDKLSKS